MLVTHLSLGLHSRLSVELTPCLRYAMALLLLTAYFPYSTYAMKVLDLL